MRDSTKNQRFFNRINNYLRQEILTRITDRFFRCNRSYPNGKYHPRKVGNRTRWYFPLFWTWWHFSGWWRSLVELGNEVRSAPEFFCISPPSLLFSDPPGVADRPVSPTACPESRGGCMPLRKCLSICKTQSVSSGSGTDGIRSRKIIVSTRFMGRFIDNAYLVVDGLDLWVGHESFELFDVEIGNANRFRQTFFHHLLHFFPSVEVVDVAELELSIAVKRKEVSAFLHFLIVNK